MDDVHYPPFNRNAPLLPAAAGLAAGIAAARLFVYFPCTASVFSAAALLLIAAAKSSTSVKYSSAALLAAGFLVYFLYGPGANAPLAGLVGKGPVTLTGEVVRQPQEKDGRTVLLLAPDIPGNGPTFSRKGIARITVNGTGLGVRYGDVLRATIKLEAPRGFRNPGGFDWGEYASLRGEYAQGHAAPSDVIRLGNRSWPLMRMLYGYRDELLALAGRSLPGDEGALFKSIILGDQGSVTQTMRDRFAASGTTHILSVSGSHVALLVLFMFLAADCLFLALPHPLALRLSLWFDHKKAAAALCLAAAFFYCMLAGMEVATVRSLIMVAAFLIARMIDREAGILNILSASAIAVMAYDPSALFDISFQLSYGSVLFMTLAVENLAADNDAIRPRVGRRLFDKASIALLTSIAVIAGTAPKTAGEFNSFSIVSLPANMLAVPVAGVAAVPAGLLSCLIHAVHPGSELPLHWLNQAVLHLFLQLVGWFSEIPFSNLRPPAPGIILTSGFYTALAAALLWKAGALKKSAAVAGCLAAFMAFDNMTFPNRHEMRVTFIDVGQGDSSFVEFPDGRTMLIDGGGDPRGIDPGRAAVAPYLWNRGIRRIDILVISHPHPDHAGGLAYILENFKVGQIWEGGYPATSGEYAAFNGVALSKGIPRREIWDAGETPFGDTVIQVLSSRRRYIDDGDKEDYARENNRSLVLRIKYCGVTLLLPGDVQVDAEGAMLHASPPLPLKSTVMKVPHHGGKSSLDRRFLLAVKPEVAVISVGRSFYDKGFTAETAGFLEEIGAEVYNTSRDGAVVFKTDGRTWQVSSCVGNEPRPAAGPLYELENYRRLLP